MRKIIVVFLTLLAVLSFSSCTNTDYQNVIPADATLVAKLDVKALAEKGDLAHSRAVDVMKGYLALVVSSKDQKQAKAYIDDPMSMGLDLSMPLYFFMVGNEQMGLTAKVADEDAVKDFLLLLHKQHLASKPVEKHEQMCGTLLDEITYMYDGKTFLLLASMDKGGGARQGQLAQQLMNQKEKQSFVTTDAYDKMNETDKDFVCYSNLAALPAEWAKSAMRLLPKQVKRSDVEAISSIHFEQGKAVLQVALMGKSAAVQKLMDETAKKMHPIQGRYLDKASDNLAMWLGMGVEGEWLLQKAKEDKELKESLFLMERAIDIEQMLKAIDGDVAVEFPLNGLESGENPFVAYAQLKNTDFMQDVEDWKAGMKDYGMTMQDDGNHHYVLKADGKTWLWGVEGNDLCFAADGGTASVATAANARLKAHEKDIKNSLFFFYLDVAKWGLDKQMRGDAAMFGKALGAVDAVVVKSSSANEVEMVVELKDKQENFLKQLL